MRLADAPALHGLLEQHLSVASRNATAKAAGVIAGMLAGADSIDDLDVLRHGGVSKVFDGVRAPSTYGTFLRSFTFGHVRQLDAVHARVLAGLAVRVPRLLAGTDWPGWRSSMWTTRSVRSTATPSRAPTYGYSGVKGVNAADRGPVLADLRRGHRSGNRLRKGNTWISAGTAPPPAHRGRRQRRPRRGSPQVLPGR